MRSLAAARTSVLIALAAALGGAHAMRMSPPQPALRRIASRSTPRLGPPPLHPGGDEDARNDSDDGDPALQRPTGGGVADFVRTRVLQGIEPSADVAAILVVYFVQGALGLARLAVTFTLKDDLQLSAGDVAALSGVFTLPWVIKPVYGFVTDSVPFLGYRRRSYLAAAGLVGTGAYIALAAGLPSVMATVGAVVLGSASIAVSDVVVDSMVVERARVLASSASSSSSGAASEAAVSATLQS